ncbi:hypothetical protein BGZ65_003030 [Modicella reniformis]|uniref:BZIP domain-containing protein n=1 Tax=Modicella reniformis TaxID=1440133 RepID=A0A9P6M9D6_9FUNG|nr:hypothetical protein BGZ65_003030 [Modicella reniformis]
MSEAINEVNAAIVAAVAAGDNAAAFSTANSTPQHLDLNSIETLDTTTIQTMVTVGSRLKRPAEDDPEGIDENAKLRRLQEEVNNNADAAAHASGILSSNASLSTHSSSQSSNSNSSSPNPSNPGETRLGATGAAESSNPDASADQDQVNPAVEDALSAATAHLTASSHSSIMADLERMQQLAKIDPAQLASYSTNPNNQATLEQLTSSALANVLAQAPLTVSGLQSDIQLQQEHGQQHEQHHEQPSEDVQGILASIPAATADNDDNESSSNDDEPHMSGKRSSNRNATNEERRQRRLLRNRVAAKECRKKKKAYIQELQDTCTRLQEENARLYKEIEELNAKLTLGAMRIDENVRLIKEVEELNAKLTMGVMAVGVASAHAHVQALEKSASEPPTTESQSGSSLVQNNQQPSATTESV